MGAPLGPRIKPTVKVDDEGMFTIYNGKTCSWPGCGLQLTSRNRADARLLCVEHGRARDRERDRQRGRSQRKVDDRTEPPRSMPVAPHRRRVQSAFTAWLNAPTDPFMLASLQREIRDYELIERLQCVIPATDSPDPPIASIPVEEPEFNNPEHRTTRLEFLADAAYYRA